MALFVLFVVLVSMCLPVFCFFFFNVQEFRMLPAYWVTVAILHLFTILQMLGAFIVVMFLCHSVSDMQSEQALPDT